VCVYVRNVPEGVREMKASKGEIRKRARMDKNTYPPKVQRRI
jgi:hypothetical protein